METTDCSEDNILEVLSSCLETVNLEMSDNRSNCHSEYLYTCKTGRVFNIQVGSLGKNVMAHRPDGINIGI